MSETDLFGFASADKMGRAGESKFVPLSARMRPQTIDEFVGQNPYFRKRTVTAKGD
jgi:replication-associated recombination protein RarA